MADTTYIDYNTPASGKSEYFDAPTMHIFSKPAEEEDVALSPTTPSRIRTTTSLNSGGQDDGVVENAVQSSDEEHDAPDPDNFTSRDYAAVTHKRVGSTSTGGAGSDSGYESPSRRNKPRELRDDNNDIQPIPVVWAEPGTDAIQRGPKSLASTVDARRSQSMRSFHTTGTLNRDGGSIRTTASGRYTPADRRRRASLTGGTFSNGAGTVGPAAAANEEETNLFRSRSVSAESALSKKQMLKISKTELKEGKRLASVIKQEAKVEKKALEASVKELAELQKLQKYAVKEEAKTNAGYATALRKFHQEEITFLAAQAKFERAEADLQAHETAREAAREHARQATEMLQEKNREVEWLRAQKAADDREREAKIRQLKGKA